MDKADREAFWRADPPWADDGSGGGRPASDRSPLTIGETARAFCITPRALCFYERKG